MNSPLINFLEAGFKSWWHGMINHHHPLRNLSSHNRSPVFLSIQSREGPRGRVYPDPGLMYHLIQGQYSLAASGRLAGQTDSRKYPSGRIWPSGRPDDGQTAARRPDGIHSCGSGWPPPAMCERDCNAVHQPRAHPSPVDYFLLYMHYTYHALTIQLCAYTTFAFYSNTRLLLSC